MLGVIGGSGLTEFPELDIISEESILTPYGDPSAAIIIAKLWDQEIVFLARHGRPHRIPPHKINYRANLWALQHLGVDRVISVNAVGGISETQDTGVIAIPDQIVDYTYSREMTYSDSAAVELKHVDFTYPYNEALRLDLLSAAKTMSLAVVDSAVHGVTQGPRLESAAEIRRLAMDGCDIVGMTGMPEAGLARELELDFACVSLVVNKAAGCSDILITMDDIHNALEQGMGKIKALIGAYCHSLLVSKS